MKLEIFITPETLEQLQKLQKHYGNVSLQSIAGFILEDAAKQLNDRHAPQPPCNND